MSNSSNSTPHLATGIDLGNTQPIGVVEGLWYAPSQKDQQHGF